MYIEIDMKAVPYKYLSQIRAFGTYNDTIVELMEIVRRSGKYFRMVEVKEFSRGKGSTQQKMTGLQIETSLGNGVYFEQEPLGGGFGERSNHFRHCRQSTLVTI